MLDLVNKILKIDTNENFISIDIGSGNIKIVSIISEDESLTVNAVATIPTPVSAISNNIIVEPELIAESIVTAMKNNNISEAKVVYSLPGPSVFTKKIKTSKISADDFKENLSFEAASYVPHEMSSVKLDFQIISSDEQDMEVLLVAVKDEIIDSYKATIVASGLVPAVADVDYFAISNMYELNYPEDENKLVAILDVSSKYTGVSLIKDKIPYFTGDIPVGGKLYTDAIMESLGLEHSDAEQVKLGESQLEIDKALLADTLDRTTDYIAGEIHRQLGFFWTAAELETGIEKIYLCGGACVSHGLINELKERTGIECEIVDPFKKINTGSNIDRDYLKQLSLFLSPSAGLGIRKIGDKVNAE